ncbi:MlaD family protein [Aliifodinibius sp. S!AR15-10]|uniref:MlaD family protein n=1 Tax=Aliifodinibius sp. S!AR15-10 TaxID=2950437 RepID=UPI00285A032A|nr:MlaD family protein [Aliifodinibius sp. S!AR15-10]MDR8392688.1 MlaD family protein [Aliifodinibius sp. S!AR15-10]
MAKISNELKVAITIIASLVVAFLGFRVMQDMPVFRQSHKINAYFDRVDGLSAGNYVYINGVKVGSVKQIQLANSDSVLVGMTFDLGVDIPEGSVALLESSGLLNEKAIIIQKGNSNELVPYDGFIKGRYEGGMMETLKNEGEKLSNNVSSSFNKLNTLLEELNRTLTEENRNRIEETLTNLESTSDNISGLINNKRNKLESSIDHANSILANIDTLTTDNRQQIDSALVRMNSSLQAVEKLSKELNATSDQLNTILGKIERGDGTLGKLVNDSSLYNRYDSLAVEMQTLIEGINNDPQKYLKHMRLIEVF